MQVITVCAYLWLSHSRLSTRHKHFILWYLLRADKLSRSCIWMWNQRSWRAKKNNFSVYSLQRRVAICPFCYQTIGSFRVSLRAERWKCFLLTRPMASSFRVWSISWRPSLWRISSPTGVCCTRGSWCSQVGTDSSVICPRSRDTSRDLTLFFFGSLLENTKLVDVYLFLFDEFLLITKIKRNKKVRRCSQPELGRVQVCRVASELVHSVCVCVLSSCVAVHGSRSESSEGAAEPGAGSAAEGGVHVHGSGPARLSGPAPAEEHWSAQRLK